LNRLKYILNSEQHILSLAERQEFQGIVFDKEGIPDDLRGLFWQKCSGILAYKHSYCPHYYDLIGQDQSYFEDYPNPHFAQIDKDLDRTYPLDPFYTTEIKNSMRRIFRAYVWRNPQVGYIQGISFPFFRIRKFLSEEDTFWLMCILVESYLPPDFYVEMYGATTHATILYKIFR
jgi:TBC1 domain family member 8/9